MDHLRKQQRDFLKKINCNDIGKKVDEIVTYINREEKLNNMGIKNVQKNKELENIKKAFDEFIEKADEFVKKQKDKQKIKHEIPGKTIYWGEEAPEKMTWEEAKEWCVLQGGRLPTRLELLQAYEDNIDGFAPDYYWSSAENNSNAAWYQYFNGSTQSFNHKNNLYRVRCVRD
jgi:hypothetical protein